MSTCKECFHFEVCESFCGGIPRIQKLGDYADRDCGHFDRKITIDGKEISPNRVRAIISSACKELELSPLTLAKWRPCYITNPFTENVFDGYMCTCCGTRSKSMNEMCDVCGAVIHGIDQNIHIAIGEHNE